MNPQVRRTRLTVAINAATGVLVALVAGVEVARKEANVAVVLLADDFAVDQDLLVHGHVGLGRDCVQLLVRELAW